MKVFDTVAPVYEAVDIALNYFDASGHRCPEVSRNCLMFNTNSMRANGGL